MNVEERKAFARAVKRVRTGLRYKQVYCAGLIGITERQWRRWERGESAPSPMAMMLLEAFFPELFAASGTPASLHGG